MRVALTGTPGTGKTSVADRLDLPTVHLNDVVREEGLWTDRDADRDSLVVDLEAVTTWLAANADESADPVVLESHFAHLLAVDRVVVLRCHPAELERRLRDRGVEAPKVAENAESEAIDVVLTEAVDRHGRERVYEVDTTDRSVDAVADAVRAILDGECDPGVGTVDFTDYL